MKRPRLNKYELLFISASLRLREKTAESKYENVELLFDRLKELREKMRREGPKKYLKDFKATKEEYLRERGLRGVYIQELSEASSLARRFEGLLANRKLHVHIGTKTVQNI